MNEIAIRAHNLGKRYWIGGDKPKDSLRDALAHSLGAPLRRAVGLMRGHGTAAMDQHVPLWALRNVSFDVSCGEVLGIIGHNGAGKSTLLKLLARITTPTEGSAELVGRVASLLEIGTGFHPDLTGEENIHLNGAILGMSRREVKRAFGDIAAFAGVEKFLQTPVKHYSSGMYTRLAFAVAAHLTSEILIVDEVLAVGDLEFQRKCFERMGQVARSGRTILFVSHNLAAVSNLCDRAILLDGGRITDQGGVDSVVRTYLSRGDDQGNGLLRDRTDRRGSGAVRMVEVRFGMDGAGLAEEGSRLISGQPAWIQLSYVGKDDQSIRELRAAVTVTDFSGVRLFTCSTRFQGGHFREAPARGVLTCRLPSLPLSPGRFRVNVWCAVEGETADQVENAARFEVTPVGVAGTGQVPEPGKHGPIMLPHTWSINEDAAMVEVASHVAVTSE